jgi:hypothetical protein
MNDARGTAGILPRPLRDQRRAAGLVAEYIHELSGRHGVTRQRSLEAAAHPGTESEVDNTTESQGG